MKEDLLALSELVKQHNKITSDISKLIGRPALTGHLGEYIASIIFDIRLADSASNKAIDGWFSSGNLEGKSVNVKWFTSHDGLMNLCESNQPDYYLVLTGEYHNPGPSRGRSNPWVITNIYLFDSEALIEKMRKAGTKIGTASSIKKMDWEAAEIYPNQTGQLLRLNQEQKDLLSLFA